MYKQFLSELKKLGVRKGSSFLVALSGGSDSTALLLLILKAAKEEDFHVEAFHLNHGIRGEEAKRDEEFSKNLSNSLNVPFHCAHVSILEEAEKLKMGTEECGRLFRYRLLEETRQKNNLDYILTAHNRDDLEETLLFRLARGASLKGMGGIPQKRGAILRPMLSFTKKEIEEFLEKEQCSYVEDSTNSEDLYERNYIRHHLLEPFRNIGKNAWRTAALLSEDEEFLSSLVPENLNLSLKNLQELPPPLLRRWLLLSFDAHLEKEHLPYHNLELSQIEALSSLIYEGKISKSLSLPSKVKVTVTKNGLLYSGDKEEPSSYKVPLNMGETVLCNGKYTFYLTDRGRLSEFLENKRKVHKTFIKVQEGSATMGEGLFICNKKDGDSLFFGGMTRSVSKLLSEKKIPLNERPSFPILHDEKGVLWVPGFPVRQDRNPQNENEKQILILFWERNTL